MKNTSNLKTYDVRNNNRNEGLLYCIGAIFRAIFIVITFPISCDISEFKMMMLSKKQMKSALKRNDMVMYNLNKTMLERTQLYFTESYGIKFKNQTLAADLVKK